MDHLNKLALLCVTVAIASCASTKPHLSEIKIPPERIVANGYSLVPLNEEGWMIAQRNAYQFALVKSGINPDESLVIQAIPFRLPEYKTNADFVRMTKEGQAKDIDPQRFKILQHDVTSYPMKGTDCAKSYMVGEDNAAVKKSGKSGSMIINTMSITCALPSEKNVGISIVYSQRSYPGQGDPAFVEKATSIINSVEFSEAPQMDGNSPAAKFSALCTDVLAHSSDEQIPEQLPLQSVEKQVAQSDDISKLTSIGISIWQHGGAEGKGSYALFGKDPNGSYSLIAIQPNYIEPEEKNNQEVLFISNELDGIAPAFNRYILNNKDVFVCGTGSQKVTRIGASMRAVYNPCDSSLTSASNVGTSILVNTLLTIASMGVNIVTGSTATYVDTDKKKVANLVVNSKLFQCLNQANQKGLKAEILALSAKK